VDQKRSLVVITNRINEKVTRLISEGGYLIVQCGPCSVCKGPLLTAVYALDVNRHEPCCDYDKIEARNYVPKQGWFKWYLIGGPNPNKR
jgi:hypothetical protein